MSSDEQAQRSVSPPLAPKRRQIPRWMLLDLDSAKSLPTTSKNRTTWRERFSSNLPTPTPTNSKGDSRPALRESKYGYQGPSWTLTEVKAGISEFFEEFGRYPSAEEFDSYPYLPSARSIERKFGGLKALRTQLGLPLLHSGENRSRIATAVGVRGKEIELTAYEVLVDRFGESFVHREAPIDERGWKRLDFLIYTESGKIGIDVFAASTPQTLKTMLYIKLRKFDTTEFPIFFALANSNVTQSILGELSAIHDRVQEKKIDVRICTIDQLHKELAKFNPIKLNSRKRNKIRHI